MASRNPIKCFEYEIRGVVETDQAVEFLILAITGEYTALGCEGRVATVRRKLRLIAGAIFLQRWKTADAGEI